MSAQPENFPGARPSKGTIRIAQVVSSSKGANSGLSVHPHGHRLVSSWFGANSTLDLWVLDNGQHLQSVQLDVELPDVGAQVDAALAPVGAESNRDLWAPHILPIVDSALDERGTNLVLGAGRGVRVLKLSPTQDQFMLAHTMRGHDQAVTRVAVDSAGNRALSADSSGTIQVWSTETGGTLNTLRISKVPQTISFIWQDMLALAGDSAGRVICWELEHGRRHLQFQAHHGQVFRTAYNGESGVLATIGADNAARLWNLEQGKQIGRDMSHRAAIGDVCFAYAGRFVVTCGVDGHIAIWNSTDGDILDWYFDNGPIYRVAFNRLAGTLVIAGARTMKVLQVDWQRLREVDADSRVALDFGTQESIGAMSRPASRPVAAFNPNDPAGIGAMMAARQTSDLPFPDRSNLSMGGGGFDMRGGASMAPVNIPSPGASQMPGMGGAVPVPGASHGTMAFSNPFGNPAPNGTGAIPNATPFGTPAAFANDPNRAGNALQPNPYGVAGTVAPGASNTMMSPGKPLTFGGGSLAAALESNALRQAAEDASTKRSSYGITAKPVLDPFAIPPDPPQGADTTAFFQSPAQAGQPRISRIESDMFEGAGEQESAPPSGQRGAPAQAESKAEERPKKALSPQEMAAAAERRKSVGIIAIATVICGVVGWGAAYGLFTTTIYPSAIQNEANSAQEDFERRTNSAQTAFESFKETKEKTVSDFEERGGRTPADIDRFRREIQRQISEQEATAQALKEEAEQEFNQKIESLRAQRVESAKSTANIAAASLGLVALLLTTALTRRKRAA